MPILLAAALALGACESPKNQLLVSVSEQKMLLVDPEGAPVAVYPVSTSKFGLGDERGSYRTPLGRMEVAQKIGHGAPHGAVFKSRRPTGEILPPDAPGRDPIVTRILWLRGKESQNRNAYGRYIYIHGTPEERNIGLPASYGCIRMKSSDVSDLFDRVTHGSEVVVTTQPLPRIARRLESPKRLPKDLDDPDTAGLLARLNLPGFGGNRGEESGDGDAAAATLDKPTAAAPESPPEQAPTVAGASARKPARPGRTAGPPPPPDTSEPSATLAAASTPIDSPTGADDAEAGSKSGFFSRLSLGSLFSRKEESSEAQPPQPDRSGRPAPRGDRPSSEPSDAPAIAAASPGAGGDDWRLTHEQARRLFLLHEAEQAVDSAN